MRSAAPLSSRQVPTTAAKAMTSPTLAAASPKARATRLIFSPVPPAGFSKLTTIAAASRAKKALTRSPKISPSTTATPTARMRNGSMGAAGSGGEARGGCPPAASVSIEPARPASAGASAPRGSGEG